MTATAHKTNAFVGQDYLAVGDGNSPESYTRFCEITNIGGIGVKNDQVEATTFCSGGSKEYIAGLSDGNDVTFTANYTLIDTTIQNGLIDDVENKARRSFQLQVGDDSPSENFSFDLAMLTWEYDPSLSSKNEIKFGGKITGRIIRSAG
jgi:hypothetical protein